MSFRVNGKLSLLTVSIFLCDALLKMYVHHFVPPMNVSYFPYGGIEVFRKLGVDFVITHVVNKGAMWGFFSNHQFLLILIRVIIITALICYLYLRQLSNYRRTCLFMVLAGAMGNVFDCIIYGHVIDMFCFTFWGYIYPVFNIADASIFCGILMMLLEPSNSKSVANSLK